MKLRSVYSLAIFGLLAACSPTGKVAVDHSSEIIPLMNAQQEAWNRGDIPSFMEPYWKSDSLVFIGKRGVTKGWKTTVDNYYKSYPDKESMGRLEFGILKNEGIGDSAVYTIGKWTLYRTADTLGGHFTLLWKNIDGKWKIVADHSS